MRRIHLIGRRNHGKTTLIMDLVPELQRRGLTVGTIKHSGHDHDLDAPGKDSWKHGQAGASPAAVVTPGGAAIFQRRRPGASPYEALEGVYGALDLVLVEGDVETDAPKVEVWRAVFGAPPLASNVPGVRALVSDDAVDVGLPVWPRRDVAQLASLIVDLAREDPA
jgi:molybdopterin-guanine dinucleotide biosynthesis protein MobB